MYFYTSIVNVLYTILSVAHAQAKVSKGLWTCPNVTTELSIYEVCAPPKLNQIDCPNGRDQDPSFCTKEKCYELGLYPCYFDPYCVKDQFSACLDCPSGGQFYQVCRQQCKGRRRNWNHVIRILIPNMFFRKRFHHVSCGCCHNFLHSQQNKSWKFTTRNSWR